MNILLIYPPHNLEILSPFNFEPLALEILASTVPEHAVKIFDLRFDTFDQLNYLLSTFQPRVVGITVNNTIHVNQAKKILKYIKRGRSDVKNIVGGHHPTLRPSDFFKQYIDAIFLGCSERNFPQYISWLQSNKNNETIESVIRLKKGIPINQYNWEPATIEPEEIPVPNRNLTRKYSEHYRNELGCKTVLVNTARGCPYRCTFCACWKVTGGKHVVRSAEDVFKELIKVPDDIDFVFFADDNTFFDIERAEKLCYLIKKHDIRKKYSGYCRTDTIVKYPQLFDNWKEIGLDKLTIGFETTKEETLKRFKKSNSLEINREAIHILNDLEIQFSPYFLIEPEFKEDDFKEIFAFVEEYNLIRPMFTILTPLPGTALYEEMKEKINLDFDYFDFMHWVYPPRMNAKKFYGHFVKLYNESYSYKRYFKTVFRKHVSWFKKNIYNKWESKHIPLIELILLRILVIPLRRKLYRQYFNIKKI